MTKAEMQRAIKALQGRVDVLEVEARRVPDLVGITLEINSEWRKELNEIRKLSESLRKG